MSKNTETNEIVMKENSAGQIFLRQLKNPLLLILVVATIVAFIFAERFNAGVILFMICLSVFLGFFNEFSAEKTVKDLLKKISFMATVVRNNVKLSIPARDIRIGDEVLLYPGAVVPADLKLTVFENLQINESVLTGEAMAINKNEQDDAAYMGTNVVSGTGMGQVSAIGRQTKFGQISATTTTTKPETQFQKGLDEFGKLLMWVVVIMGGLILGVNLLLGRPMIEAVLFALTVAIGLTPELLPVVVTVSLAHGARRLAKKEVLVKQLTAIEDLGNMEVLCSDKTGTLTEGKLQLVSHQNPEGNEDDEVLKLGLICNSAVVHHKVFGDQIDTAIWEHARHQGFSLHEKVKKIDEQPFDFEHRGMFTVTEENGDREYIFKGAPDKIMEIIKITPTKKIQIEQKIKKWYGEGFRVIGVATKKIEIKERYDYSQAKGLNLAGFILFSDPPKHGARQALDRFEALGVKLKIITGDNEIVTEKICRDIDIPYKQVITGPELHKLTEIELAKRVWEIDVFARMTPDAKLRIIKALRQGGHTVGYIGDGVNDAPALHEADVGISVDTAVDVAKDTASIVLLRKSLQVIVEGITEGRRTFANTRKYILMGTSSNFGNMFSMVGASFLLPFLPMTPTQILLANVIYDISQLAIPTDHVDQEDLAKPNSWNVKQIKKFMLFFGPISSLYDFLMFGIMFWIFQAGAKQFQSGWFVESLATQILVIFVIRTKVIPFWKSRPSGLVIVAALVMTGLAVLLPYSSLGGIFGMTKLPMGFFGVLIVMVGTYLGLVELGKRKVLTNTNL